MFIYQSALKNQYYDKVIDLRYKQNMTIRGIAKILPLSKNTILRWITIFAEENPHIAAPYRMKKKKIEPAKSEAKSEQTNQMLPNDVQALQAELKRLRAELTNAEIKAEAYDELINVAEAKFGIQIRKKAGAKQ